jgi:predicted DNA-binding transcriptional regulator AlpA
MLDKTQVAGYLGVRVRRVDELRRSDVTFPPPRLLSPGTARWRRADLDRWIEGLRSGWCTTGGRREGAFVGHLPKRSVVLSKAPKRWDVPNGS